MKLPAVVIDTNVVVSGLITVDKNSPVCRILDGMLSGCFTFILSPALIDEYRSVMLRPKIQALHGLTDQEVDRILSNLVMNAAWREPETTAAAPDPGDSHLWALLNAHAGGLLVTGDGLLLDNPPGFASVLTPRSFVELLKQL